MTAETISSHSRQPEECGSEDEFGCDMDYDKDACVELGYNFDHENEDDDDEDYNYTSEDDFDFELEDDCDHQLLENDDDIDCQGSEDEYSKRNTATLVDSFESYIVVSVLTATAAFAALLDDSPNNEVLAKHETIAHNVAILCSAICSLGGIYATVVFSFSSIYGRTAIGNGRTELYEIFLQRTSSLRKKAFYMYLLSLALFIVLLVIAASDKMESTLEGPFLAFLSCVSLYMYRDWRDIIIEAGPIFAPAKNKEKPSHREPQPRRLRSSTPVAEEFLSLPPSIPPQKRRHSMTLRKRGPKNHLRHIKYV